MRAAHYDLTVSKLVEDPIILAMARELPREIVDEFRKLTRDELPWDFMCRALDTYKARGGTIPTHIGGPAEAVHVLIKL